MKLKQLFSLVFFCTLIIFSCTKDDFAEFNDNSDLQNQDKISIRGPQTGPTGPGGTGTGTSENCCDFTWDIVSIDNSGECCEYTIAINNLGRCLIRIPGLISVRPFYGNLARVTVCEDTRLEVFAGSQTTPCGYIWLEADCSTESPCSEDCVSSFTVPYGPADFQFIEKIELGSDCSGNSVDLELDQLYLTMGNTTVCSDIDMARLYNEGLHEYDLKDMSEVDQYIYGMQSVIRKSIEGCEGVELSIFQLNQGALNFELKYDCETCPISLFEVTKTVANIEDCENAEPHPITWFDSGQHGGQTNCGTCN